ncbi:MAG: hypothetical protein ACREX8_11345 [Gammaproteobacteria bacterium]
MSGEEMPGRAVEHVQPGLLEDRHRGTFQRHRGGVEQLSRLRRLSGSRSRVVGESFTFPTAIRRVVTGSSARSTSAFWKK